MEPKVTKISTDLLQAVVNYVTTKPFNEVNGLLAAIQKDIAEKNQLASVEEAPVASPQ